MRKLILHLLIASTTFFSSLGLTKLIHDSSTGSSVPPQTVQAGNVAPTTIEFRDTTDEQKLLEIYRQYGPAKTIGERAFFERVESKSFMLFFRDRNMTREENVRWMQMWPHDVVYDYYVESIRIVGDAAVVTGGMRAKYRNGTFGSCGFIDVWIRDGSNWKILSTTSVDC